MLGLLAPCLFYWLIFPSPHYLGRQPARLSYGATRFEFRFGHATRIVEDPQNHMQWVYGSMPDSITVEGRTRVIVYVEPKAIIKSWSDSMEAQNDTFRHKGYMGISTTETKFYVDAEGVSSKREA